MFLIGKKKPRICGAFLVGYLPFAKAPSNVYAEASGSKQCTRQHVVIAETSSTKRSEVARVEQVVDETADG